MVGNSYIQSIRKSHLISSRLWGPYTYNHSQGVLTLLDTILTSSLRLAPDAYRTSLKLSLCAEAAKPPLSNRRLILTFDFLSTISQYPHLLIYNPICLPNTTHPSVSTNERIRFQFQHSLNLHGRLHGHLCLSLSQLSTSSQQ